MTASTQAVEAAEREKFEFAYDPEWSMGTLFNRNEDDTYLHEEVQSCWEIWQKARAELRLHTGLDQEMGFILESANAGELAAYDHAVQCHCDAVLDILDGNDNGGGANNEPWSTVRKRLLQLTSQQEVAAPSRALCDAEREPFEKWALALNYSIEKAGLGLYKSNVTNHCFQGWLALAASRDQVNLAACGGGGVPEWHVEYSNDTGPNDESFMEWWEVTNGRAIYTAHTAEAAEKLCSILNAAPKAQEGNK